MEVRRGTTRKEKGGDHEESLQGRVEITASARPMEVRRGTTKKEKGGDHEESLQGRVENKYQVLPRLTSPVLPDPVLASTLPASL
jgi:hypothetical protein